MFWGCKVKENKPVEIKRKEDISLHLTDACLGNIQSTEKFYLQLHVGHEKFNLCAFQKDKWETHKLDHYLNLNPDDKVSYKLALLGGGNNVEVHVTGYFEKEDIDDEEQEEIIEDDIQDEIKTEEKPKMKESPVVNSEKKTLKSPEKVKPTTPQKEENGKLLNKKRKKDDSEDEDFENEDDEDSEHLLKGEDDTNIDTLLKNKQKIAPVPQKLQKIEETSGNKKGNHIDKNKPKGGEGNKNQNGNKNGNNPSPNKNFDQNKGNSNQNQNKNQNKNQNQNQNKKEEKIEFTKNQTQPKPQEKNQNANSSKPSSTNKASK
jgi:hypothetical protein